MSSCKKNTKKTKPCFINGTAIGSSIAPRRLIKDCLLESMRPAQKPHLTPVMKKKRLDLHMSSPLDSRWVDESIMQPFVPRHIHLRQALVQRFHKTYVEGTMKYPLSQVNLGRHVALFLYLISLNTTNEWTQIRGIAHREDETTHVRPQLHYLL